MSDIETMRKELETAKRIRDNGYDCIGLAPSIVCTPDCCPAKTERCRPWKSDDWDVFISSREAELAALENTPKDGLSHVQTAPEKTLRDADALKAESDRRRA